MQRRTEGSMLCPSCRKLISVSAEKCPHCGAARPGLWGFGPGVMRLVHRLDPLGAIPVACIGLYVLALALDPRAILSGGGGIFGILSPSSKALFLLGSTASHDLTYGRFWTMISAIYLHGGILHIAFNLMWVRYLGPGVEQAFGAARFFVIWTFAGFLGFLLSNLWPGPGSVGASGSVFGLLAALIVAARRTGDSVMLAQLWQWVKVLGTIGVVVLLLGRLVPGLGGIDHLAHVGGFLGGWIAAYAFRDSIGRPSGRGLAIAALALAGLTIASFVLSLVTGILILRA